MSHARPSAFDFFQLDGGPWVASGPTGIAGYDFPFRSLLPCRSLCHDDRPTPVVARIGAFADHAGFCTQLAELGLSPVHDAAMHALASELPEWYPRIADLTPRSRWYAGFPDAVTVSAEFAWPVFLKGARQSSRHDARLAIARDPDDLARIGAAWAADPILSWQAVVVREFLQLRRVAGEAELGRLPPAFEFRTFWWRGRLVGSGPYWPCTPPYSWTADEERQALAVAAAAARRVAVTFLVVDLAQCADGRWVVIECNDAQESGYAGVNALALWQRIIASERRTTDRT